MSNAPGQVDGLNSGSEWVLKRNCALTPTQLLWIFGSLAMLSLGMAAFWAAQGAWVVLPFAVLEVLALAIAFAVYARHAADCERVRLSPEMIEVERVVGASRTISVLPRAWLRVRLNEQSSGLVELSAGRSVESVGRFVDLQRRRRFLVGLQEALQG
ncbi:MAG: DUF2244 domain-containing protein [Burkholderiaceae bacterium]|jgi:uncharacterized membrane protein